MVLTAMLLFVPGIVFSDVVTFKVGFFMPRAQSDLWEIEFDQMSFSKSHFQTTNFSFSYEYFVSREISIVFGVDGYTKNKTGVYNDYVGLYDDEGYYYAFDTSDVGTGDIISHVFSVSITPIQASIKLTPIGRKAKIIPYVAGGVGAYLWTVRLQGEMVDFEDGYLFELDEAYEVVGYTVFSVDAREENKIRFGFHVMGGIMVPIANRISLAGEVKYHLLEAPFKDGFIGFEPFDLSGMTISIGLNYWF